MNLLGTRLTVSAIILMISFLCSPSVYGQSVKRVEGIVSDITGAMVSGAKITLVTDDRVWTTETNSDGEFDFANFTGAVRYIEVYSVGFSPSRIAIADTAPQPVKVTLRPGTGNGIRGEQVELEPVQTSRHSQEPLADPFPLPIRTPKEVFLEKRVRSAKCLYLWRCGWRNAGTVYQ